MVTFQKWNNHMSLGADVGQHRYCVFLFWPMQRQSTPCPNARVLNLRTTDIVDWTLLCCRTVLCPAGHLKASLTSIPYMLVSPHPLTQLWLSKMSLDFAKCFRGQNCSQLRIPALKLADALEVRANNCKHASELNGFGFGKLWDLRGWDAIGGSPFSFQVFLKHYRWEGF